jgi:hypothetical protein
MADRPALFDEPTQPVARSWREAFARLSASSPPCPGFSVPRWQNVHTPCLRFLSDHADETAAKGWTAEELFGVHPAMGADRIAFEQGSYRRAPGAPASVPVWDWRERC